MAWKSPAETLQEWKEQRARERRRDNMATVGGPASPIDAGYNFGRRQSLGDRPDLVNSAGIGNPTATSAQGAGLQATADMGAFPLIQRDAPAGLPGQQSTQGIAEIFGAPQEGPGYPFSGMFDQPPGMARPFKRQEAAVAGQAPLIAGPSISDRVRGNRYANMDPRERQALNLTIAGELSPYSYGKPVTDQEVANMVETVTTRAAKTGDSIEDTVRDPWQYSPWNTLPDQAKMRENLEAHGPDVRRMVANAITGDVMPTHEGLTHYLNRDAVRRIPDWATADKRAAKVGPHTFYRDVDPYDTAQSLLPPSPAGEITSRDLAPLPQPLNAPVGPVTAGTDLPPPSDYVAPPPYTGGPVNAPLVTPPALSSGFTPESGMPASPVERMETGLATPQIGDPGLQQALGPRPPLIALAEDRATRERALPGTPAGVPQTPLRGPAPMPGVDMGQASPAGAVQPTPVTTTPFRPGQQLGPAPLVAPAAPAAAAPLIAPAAPVSTMRDVARAARGTGVDYVYRDPVTNILSGFDDKQPWTPEQQATIAGAVPGIATDGGLRLNPAAPARPPLVAPAAAVPSGAPLVTPRQTVTPQTPVSPEPESNLPPLPSTTVPNVPSVTPAPVQPLIAPTNPMDQFAGRTPALDISVGPKGHERGERKFAQGEKLAGRIGMGIGGVGGLVGGGIPGLVAGAGLGRTAGRATARGLDPNRSIFERGPLGFFGNIFGFGRGRDKDKDKDKDKRPEGLSKKDTGISSPPSSAYGGYGNRYQGGTYSGQSTGGRYLTEGTGGAFR